MSCTMDILGWAHSRLGKDQRHFNAAKGGHDPEYLVIAQIASKLVLFVSAKPVSSRCRLPDQRGPSSSQLRVVVLTLYGVKGDRLKDKTIMTTRTYNWERVVIAQI